MVSPVFRELLILNGRFPLYCFVEKFAFTLLEFQLLLLLFEFIAYLTRLNSNPFGSSDPWVAARASGVPGGGSRMSGCYSGIRAQGSKEICNGLITMVVPKIGTNIFCKGSVDPTILGVDTMVQNKGRNVKKSSSQFDSSPEQVDTESSQVDTRDLSQGFVLPVWESV
ncbi:hypothetical protein Taro_044207 [Colocasia esculenta]|uniref:Uncharacterized protein n=1 Tax=Colocasia esculenta TaxID=4460 RepID=A0A843X560_COLES|nr:hypothetical protein [Colocasia esculenta]